MNIYNHFSGDYQAIQTPSGNYLIKRTNDVLEVTISELPFDLVELTDDWEREVNSQAKELIADFHETLETIFKIR